MHFTEKLATLRADLGTFEGLEICVSLYPPAPPEAIAALREQFPGLPDDYWKFLTETDGCYLDQQRFFGTDHTDGAEMSAGAARWAWKLEEELRIQAIAVGETTSTGCLALCPDGAIRKIYIDTRSLEDARVLAGSYAELIGDVLMGSKYPTFYAPYPIDDDSEWVTYLRAKQWL